MLEDSAVAILDNDLEQLTALDLPALRALWREIYTSGAPPRLGLEFLRRALAYRRQELALGGLSRKVQLRLKALERRRPGGEDGQRRQSGAASIKPGTRFVRAWQGQVYEVQAIERGQFVYAGKSFRSLTLTAREITGTHQSGPRFFGLRAANAKQPARKPPIRMAGNG